MLTFCLREAPHAKWTRLFASACPDENICIEMSKVSPLLLQVYTTDRCLHLTPIKEKKHPEDIYSVLGLGLSKQRCAQNTRRTLNQAGHPINQLFL